jgi:hypothetical protein
VRWEHLLDPDRRGDPILRRDYLRDMFPGMFWDTQMSGIQIASSIAERLEIEWKDLIDDLHPS